MIDIATLGLTLCLAAGNIEYDKVTYSYDNDLKSQGVNGITLYYTKSVKWEIKISSEFKIDEYSTRSIVVHELAHVLVTQRGGAHEDNYNHRHIFKETCAELKKDFKGSINSRTCRTKVKY